MARQQVTVPDIGGAENAEVIEVLVAVGDEVARDQGLLVLESDKASMEIPSTAAGRVVELLVSEGAQLSEGSPVAVIEVVDGAGEEAAGEAGPETVEQEEAPASGAFQDGLPPDTGTMPDSAAAAPAEEKAPAAGTHSRTEPAPVAAATAQPAAVPEPGAGVYAGPSVRKLARELGVDLQRVKGSGPRARILKEDLQQYVQRSLRGQPDAAVGGAIPAVPEVDFTRFGEVEVTERSKVDKLTAANMQRSWLNLPHVTQFDDADITELESFRAGLKPEAERRDVKLSPLPFILKACAVALRDNPKFNSSLAAGGDQLVFKRYCHIGMAVDTPAGLVVPVIRDVDRKSLWELAAEVQALAAKARERKLSPAEMQGGCFTVSSLGNIGGNGFTPIINPPEVGILGVSRAAVRPVWDGGAFVPRTLLPLALSYDHRVINGGDAGRFLTQLVGLLEDLRRLLL